MPRRRIHRRKRNQVPTDGPAGPVTSVYGFVEIDRPDANTFRVRAITVESHTGILLPVNLTGNGQEMDPDGITAFQDGDTFTVDRITQEAEGALRFQTSGLFPFEAQIRIPGRLPRWATQDGWTNSAACLSFDANPQQ